MAICKKCNQDRKFLRDGICFNCLRGNKSKHTTEIKVFTPKRTKGITVGEKMVKITGDRAMVLNTTIE